MFNCIATAWVPRRFAVMREAREKDPADGARRRLTWQALAWGVAGVMHHLTFERLGYGSGLGLVYLGATLALVARPAAVGRLVVFLGITVAILAREYEELSNHMVFEFWVAGAVLGVLAVGWVRIAGSNHPLFAAYRDGAIRLTAHEFRRRAGAITGDFYVIGVFRGERFLIGRRGGELDEHPLLRPLSWIERVVVRHRDIPAAARCPCQW
jgi:hypothetical protein